MPLFCPNFCPKLGQKSDPLLLKQVLMRKTAAFLALLLASPMQGIAADRAPYPPGSGWVHIKSECSRGGTYCPGSYKVSGPARENQYRKSTWARGNGKRGKITYLETIQTYVGRPDWASPPKPYGYALNCEMWESQALFVSRPREWESITPTSVVDKAALLFCE